MPELPAPHSFIGFTDPVSSLSHLLGAVVCAAMAVPLIRRGRMSPARMWSLFVFALGCVFLLSMSGVFHLLPRGGKGRAVLQRLDHAGIFFLIAATFTPVHVILFKGVWRWGMLLLIWTIAVTGITLKTIFFNDMSELLGLAIYLGMGWIGLVSGTALARRYGFDFIRMMVWGALAYTAGAVAEFLRQPILIPGVVGPHEIFHLAVLAGIAVHWRFIRDIAGIDWEPPAAPPTVRGEAAAPPGAGVASSPQT